MPAIVLRPVSIPVVISNVFLLLAPLNALTLVFLLKIQLMRGLRLWLIFLKNPIHSPDKEGDKSRQK